MKYAVMAAILVMLPEVASAGEKSLNVGQGTWELGGSATVDMYFGNGGSDVSLTIAPQVGYFVGDPVELIGGVSLFFSDPGSSWYLFGGVDYFFASSGVQPYVGGTLGFGQYQYSFFGDDVLVVTGRGGVLLPLNRKVAVDLGGRLDIIAENDVILHIPLGFLGVRAFFP